MREKGPGIWLKPDNNESREVTSLSQVLHSPSIPHLPVKMLLPSHKQALRARQEDVAALCLSAVTRIPARGAPTLVPNLSPAARPQFHVVIGLRRA